MLGLIILLIGLQSVIGQRMGLVLLQILMLHHVLYKNHIMMENIVMFVCCLITGALIKIHVSHAMCQKFLMWMIVYAKYLLLKNLVFYKAPDGSLMIVMLLELSKKESIFCNWMQQQRIINTVQMKNLILMA